MNKGLTENWNSNFPDFPPLAHNFKHCFKERWFRIHTLPESKRYPENESEVNEILRRHNLFLTDIFGESLKYFLLTAGYGFKPRRDKKVKALNLQRAFWLSVSFAETNEDPLFWHLYFDKAFWQNDSMNNLLRLVMNDEIRNVMFFSAEKRIIYHPYDGGADIIFENSSLRNFYKEKYKDWLSKHPSGF